MKVKKAVKCKGCGIMSHNIYGKNFEYCKKCFNNGKDVTIINVGEIFSEDMLNTSITCSVILSNSQDKLLKKRLKMLFPERKGRKSCSRIGISTYLRLLILKDLKNTYGEE